MARYSLFVLKVPLNPSKQTNKQLCIINFSWYMFCLLVVLVKLSLLAKWLARKIPLRNPNRGEGITSIKPRPKRAYDCVGLLYSFIVLLHDICVLPASIFLGDQPCPHTQGAVPQHPQIFLDPLSCHLSYHGQGLSWVTDHLMSPVHGSGTNCQLPCIWQRILNVLRDNWKHICLTEAVALSIFCF